jgi:Family of unknown function (DUF5367)
MRWYILLGFLVWLVATILLRLVGQIFFATSLALVLTFFVTGVVLVLVLLLLFVRVRMDPAQRMRVALSLALPGMLLDIFSVTFVANVFPNIPATAHAAFAGCLLWAYSLVLLSALVPLPGTSSLVEE